MKLTILDKNGKKSGEMDLPKQFKEFVRKDLIKRAVEVVEANSRQKYGAAPRAGKRHSVLVSKRRRKYRGSYGFGISRTPKKVISRRGTRMNWVGAFAPNTVGGRRAHPPKSSKILSKKINITERKKALRSSLSATVDKSMVESRGHFVPAVFPLAFENSFNDINQSKDLIKALIASDLKEELNRTSERKIRAGKGKMRGRKYKTKTGLLIVIKDGRAKIVKAAKNVPGLDVVSVKNLNALLLSPGSMPGRLTIFTQEALETLDKEGLFC
jgi:large subunit ribosomal protein L4e